MADQLGTSGVFVPAAPKCVQRGQIREGAGIDEQGGLVGKQIEKYTRFEQPPNARDRHGQSWSTEEVEMLRELASCGSVVIIARRLGRTPKAIRSKLSKLGEGSHRLNGFKAKDLVALLKVSVRQVRRWRERGYLNAVAGRVTERSFTRFCQEYPDRIPYNSLDRATQRWLRDLGYAGSESASHNADAVKRGTTNWCSAVGERLNV